jgi:hypothetical protein
MSDVLDRLRVVPARAARDQVASSRAARDQVASVWVRGAFGACWAVAVGLAALIVLALVVWAADPRSVAGAGAAIRLAGQLWLLAHRTPLRIDDGAISLPPLGLTLVLGMVVARAGAIVARSSKCADARELGVVVGSVTGPYAVLATVLAALTPSASIRPSVGAAFVCAALVGGLFATIGALCVTELAGQWWRAAPFDLRVSLDAAGASAGTLVGAASLLAVGSLLAHAHRFWVMLNAYPGGTGEFSMAVLSLLLLPNAVIFAVGYLVGPGFAIGAGTSVRLGGAQLGATPAMPLLAAVPAGRPPLPVVVCCIASVVVAGAVAGWRIARRPGITLGDRLRGAVVTGGVVGLGAAVLVGFAGGPAGPGRLGAVGPSPWQVGLAVAGEIAVVAAVVVLATSWRTGRRVSSPRL